MDCSAKHGVKLKVKNNEVAMIKLQNKDIAIQINPNLGAALHRFTFKENDISDETHSAEILIPVKGEITPSENYGKKPIFRLVNAVMTRHEGSVSDISRTETALKDYIQKNNYEPITNAYYVVVRNGDTFGSDCIFEVYIGINYNSL